MSKLTFAERLVNSRKKSGLSQVAAAKAVSIAQPSLSALERGEHHASTYTPKLAKLYGVSALWLAEGKGSPEIGFSNVMPADIGTKRIPVLNYVQAGLFTDPGHSLDTTAIEHILTHITPRGDAFALEIRGDSMLPEFKGGDYIIIDCGLSPRPGDYVVARNGDGEATFKQYRLIATVPVDVFELVPLNPMHPPIRSDQRHIEIIGVMIEHRRYRR